jgi:hypothetical protein
MKIFTAEVNEKLKWTPYSNKRPLFKLFTPWTNCTWLITCEEDGILYGYGDLGMGCVEWGSLFTREEVEAIRGPFGLRIERDLHFSDTPSVNYLDLDSLAGI